MARFNRWKLTLRNCKIEPVLWLNLCSESLTDEGLFFATRAQCKFQNEVRFSDDGTTTSAQVYPLLVAVSLAPISILFRIKKPTANQLNLRFTIILSLQQLPLVILDQFRPASLSVTTVAVRTHSNQFHLRSDHQPGLLRQDMVFTHLPDFQE